MTLLRNNLKQVVHTILPLSPSSIIWYQRKLGSKQAYRVVHQPVSRGLAVFADAWLSDWLAEISADLRENGSALEVVPRRCAVQIHDFTFFTFNRCRPQKITCSLYRAVELVIRLRILQLSLLCIVKATIDVVVSRLCRFRYT